MYYLSILDHKPELHSKTEDVEGDDDAEARWDAHIEKLTGGNSSES